MDVYHKEQLVTKEEAENVASIAWRWEDVAATKDGDTIARIVDIFDKYGLNEFAHEFIRGKCVNTPSVCTITVPYTPSKRDKLL